MQIFIAMDYLILMSQKYLHSRKRQKYLANKFFSHPVEVTRSRYFGNIFRRKIIIEYMYKTLKEIEIIQVVSILNIFVNL